MTPEEKALEFANRLETQTIECPRGCLNPGLYFGYMAGYDRSQRENTLICEQIIINEMNNQTELKRRLASNCPFDCYYEGKHPGCDSDDCDYLGYAFKDVK